MMFRKLNSYSILGFIHAENLTDILKASNHNQKHSCVDDKMET